VHRPWRSSDGRWGGVRAFRGYGRILCVSEGEDEQKGWKLQGCLRTGCGGDGRVV